MPCPYGNDCPEREFDYICFRRFNYCGIYKSKKAIDDEVEEVKRQEREEMIIKEVRSGKKKRAK